MQAVALINEYSDHPEIVVVYETREELEEKIRGQYDGVDIIFYADSFFYADDEYPEDTVTIYLMPMKVW